MSLIKIQAKSCNDYEKGKNECENLNPCTSKRYLLDSNGQCKVHYYSCEDFTNDVDETKCKANIPRDESNKCAWESTCKTEKKSWTEIGNNYEGDCTVLKTTDDVNLYRCIKVLSKNKRMQWLFL